MEAKNMSLQDLADWLDSCGYISIAFAIKTDIKFLDQPQINFLHKTLANYPNPLKVVALTGITHEKTGTKA